MSLKEPRQNVKFALFALSRNQCAFPECDALMFESGSIVGDICHIHGQRPKSARFVDGLSDEILHGIGNLILLCKKHHKIVDDDESQYNADWLRRIKAEHESKDAVTPSSVLHLLLDAIAPVVPDDWADRPGAPVFQLDLASSRGDPPWTYSIGVWQISGTEIGRPQFQVLLGDIELASGHATLKAQGRWRLADVEFTPTGEAFELRFRFWWDGAERAVRWHWARDEFFQGSYFEELFE